ncbi:theronine dehydrogenase-like Zn-dependent dehydrogenase [Desulfosporosinus orientis DSM 765]|uniref:Theronine dehydrogenase-like Zn-dependent dehydrogenase n=1 Tax=Desulfosporosinus orientis (strain ATCC 19365 / DSM 765 / NCIMB 8382 / VKM B-1628 / Singapore I) TaxID=768706 RepID=G7WFH4_DESOD|nr:NAD(P)-dependent alcohol dehydrogenase [Desulfosporosinus orientis]AET68417.1 theronine dehydrogenase-like Zn-dependent dehydrogenase [Desulfosporosinus orientis DSM 765]
MKNRAAYMTGLNKMEIREIEVPVPKEKEVLVKLEYVGICGSDVHYLEHGKIGDFIVNGDFILGHECAGTIEAVGSGVEKLKVGDRVALEPGITCGQCEFCKTGRYNLCPDVEFLATPPYHGCLMNYIAFPENMAFKLPETISTKEGALVEPLAVGMHAAKQGNVKLGDSVVILGSGTIGLVTLLACKAFGATDITVVDVIPKRLEYAKKLGATTVLNAAEVDVLAEIDKLTNNKGVDVVIETAGSAQTIAQTPYVIKNGGRIVLVGMAPQDIIEYNFAKILAKEAEIKSVFRYRNIYPQAINAIAKGIIDISSIITHEFDFDDVASAFDFVINHKQEVVKGVIKIG